MLQVIVFSFNRALQLDTLLCTMLEHWKSPDYQLDVVYNSSSVDFQKGYDRLIQKLGNHSFIHFHKEQETAHGVSLFELLHPHNLKRWMQYSYLRHPRSNFRSLVIDLMIKSDARHIMFMTDDAMYVDDINLNQKIFDWILSNPSQNQYSLRVGIGMDDEGAHYSDNGEYLEWKFSKEKDGTNWGYRFSVDAHIYAKTTVLKLYKRNLFVNPNSLEGPVEGDARRSGLLDNGRGSRHTVLLSFPINMVQTISDNETLGVSTEKLNRYYLDGYTMRYPIPENIDVFQVYPNHLIFSKNAVETVMRIDKL